MSTFEDLANLWLAMPIPTGTADDAVNDFHSDLVLADEWVASTVIPFIKRGEVVPDRIGVSKRLADLGTRMRAYESPSPSGGAAIASYLDYLDLLIRVFTALKDRQMRDITE